MDWKIGILCAGDTELEPFLAHIEHRTTTSKAMLTIYEGEMGGVSVAALYSGVCKVNAAIAAQILIDTFRVNAVINAGTAGGMSGDVGLFDVVVSTACAYHDVGEDILTEFHPWLPSPWFWADKDLLSAAKRAAENPSFPHPVHFGKTVTGEAFIEEERRAFINEAFAPLSVDMESAAAAHVCHVNRVPFISIRSVTDTAEHMGPESFEQNCGRASAIAKDFVLALLPELRS